VIEKSRTFFITILFAAGGVVILTLTWIEPAPLPERIAQSIIGVVGIMTVFIRPLMGQIRATRVHISNMAHKTDINKKDPLPQ